MPAHLTPQQLDSALALQRQCWTHERIAAEIGVHRTTVSRSLSRHNRRALTRLEKQSAAIKARQVGQLEWLAEEAAAAWLKSKEAAETLKTVTGEGAKGPIDTTETTVKGQSGDPSLLRETRAALADIRGVLKLDAAAEKVGQAEARDAWQEIADELEGNETE